jgi:anti-anti-sigma factor
MPPPTSFGSALTVTVRRDGRSVTSARFDQAEISVGRSPRCDVVLDDAQVSWHHALIRLESTSGIVFSDRSSNGSFLKGERIGEAILGWGAVISIPPYEIDMVAEQPIGENEAADVRTTLLTSRPGGLATRPGHDTRGPATAPAAPPGSAPAGPRPAVELHLVQAPGSLLGEVFPIETRPLTVGRAPECDIRLTPRSISRYHARLSPAGPGRWRVEDVGSQNGVEVNGTVMRDAEVGLGDRIGFGTEIIAVLRAVPSPVAAPEPPQVESEPTTHTAMDALIVRHGVSSFHSRVTVVRIAGRIDGYSYTYLRDELGQLVDGGARYVIVDLSKCSYCDHAGLGVLVTVQVTLRQRRGALMLTGVSGQLKDAFLLLRLDQVLSLAPDEQTAAAELTKMMR